MERLRKILAPAFTVERVLGSGGMGVVFLGHDVALDRPVAIKVLHPEMFTAELGERFLLEARTLARLSTHPHIVPIHKVIEREGLYLYIMDYLGEETLSTQLERGRFTPARALRLGLDLLNGLVDVHKIGVVHRDIKPSNIFLSNQVNSASHILYDREPKTRVEKVAPWLTLDGDPYPAVLLPRLRPPVGVPEPWHRPKPQSGSVLGGR